MADLIAPHLWRRTMRVQVFVPAHEPRNDDPVFDHSRRILVDHRDTGCFICGTRDGREAHHWFEWSLWHDFDPAHVLRTLRWLDPYRDAQLMGDKPLAGPGDIRNLVILCRLHHRSVGYGIHTLPYPIWIAQRAIRPGVQLTKVAA